MSHFRNLLKPLPFSLLSTSFTWQIPPFFNIGFECIDRHVFEGRGTQTALIYNTSKVETFTFSQLKLLTDKISFGLKSAGVKKGDVAGIYMSQSVETLVAHVATYKIGGIALPLFTQFGMDAVKHRLFDSNAAVCFTDYGGLETLMNLKSSLPNLKMIVLCDAGNSSEKLPDGVVTFASLLQNQGIDTCENTLAEDPAVLIYTSGTTGNPKGCLHAHRVLLGHLPGVELPHNLFPKNGDLMWTPADWAWIGGLLDVMLPSLYHGVPLLAYRMKKFDPEEAFYMIKKFGVQNSFMPPTALKLMRQVANPKKTPMRSIGSGGESLGEELLEWGRATFNTTINEFYGQSECNLVVSNSFELFPVKPGSMGKQVPGHKVEIIDEKGELVEKDTVGNIAVQMPDPVAMLRYHNNPAATASKMVTSSSGTQWLVMGDMGKKDADGYFYYFGRDDDVIKSSGYRIGPSEIENTILKHSSVLMCAVIGKPDDKRGEIVKAFVVLKHGISISSHDLIRKEIVEKVKTELAHYEYPREIEFVKDLPMTTTGKIIRKDLRKIEIERVKSL